MTVGLLGLRALVAALALNGNAPLPHADIVGAMPNGTYKVVWQAAGADGHPNTGEFSFVVGAGGPAFAAGAAAAPEHMHMAPAASTLCVRFPFASK